ncbi:hypothetical protein ABMA28_015890 [Loxostege sticticalis]|uniref:Uncharacterized protein n=1 Tax=Loxostege sticticalis TaxID=481309 RepID=A0ABD0TBD7_LOXSC
MCFAEEKARQQALERQRRLEEAGAVSRGVGGAVSDGGGRSWYSVLGSTLLMALFAAAAKTAADPEGWTKLLNIMLGLNSKSHSNTSNSIERRTNEVEPTPEPSHYDDHCGVLYENNKFRWPPEDKEPD